MTEQELAEAMKGRSTDEVVQRFAALAEMADALGLEALVLDFEQEGQDNDRKFQAWQILIPYMRAGVDGWHDLHQALTPEEHERLNDFIRREQSGRSATCPARPRPMEVPTTMRVATPTARSARLALAGDELLRAGLTTKTIEHYELYMSRAETWCLERGVDLLKVSPEDLVRFVAAQRASRGSQRVIRCALAHYWRANGRDHPPLDVIVEPRPAPTDRRSSLGAEEVRDLGASVLREGGKPAAAAALALLLGLTGGQIAQLRWEDLRAEGTIRIRDGAGRSAVMEVHPALAEVLRRQKQTSPWIFPSHASLGHVRPETVYAWLRLAAVEAGVEGVRADALRRSPVTVDQSSILVEDAALLASKDKRRRPPGAGVERVEGYRLALRQLGLAPRTVKNYVRIVARAEEWCAEQDCTLVEVSADQLQTYIALQPRSHETLNAHRKALLHYWRICHREDAPLWVIRVPRKPRMICRALDDVEAKRLAEHAKIIGGSRGAAVELGLYQALRVSEIAQVRWSDFEGNDGWMQVMGKGDLPASLPVHPVVRASLNKLPRSGEWIFPGRKRGGPISAATAWDWIRKVGEQSGVASVTPHRLRHTALAVANDRTGDLRAVMEFARHARPETTAGYTRTTARRMLEVVASISYAVPGPANGGDDAQR